ncbi:ester cyclase [Streptacidiphilus anmyonensis]|uniref:ester cyclase n=1 Tax=Streptacidiphilus anmyonensis TaxID=405782 RepID=UPI0005AA1136|nr:ester cyclase [Streptacidiphilus anmyonensis]
MSTPESNVQRMLLFVEQVQQNGRLELIENLVQPDFRNDTVEPGQPDDRAGIGEIVAAMHMAFSHLRIEILHCIGDGDLVATHKVLRGRHTGPWFSVPPSGNPIELRVMDLVRYRDGKWAEHWAVADAAGLLRQTGALG